MTNVIITPEKFSYDKESKTFKVDGRKVPFASSYILRNTKTGGEMKFEFDHSTGSEWNPETKWIYKNNEFTLEVGNEDVTPIHAFNYMQAKQRI